MSQRKIVIEPDPILRKKSEKLEKVDDELRALLYDMRYNVRCSRYRSCSSSDRNS